MNAKRNPCAASIVALAAILTFGVACEPAGGAQGGAGGLLGKVGSGLSQLRKGNGTLSFDGAAEQQGDGQGRPSGRGESAEGSEEPTPRDDGLDGRVGCRAACEHILVCVVESCPALGLPSVEDMGAVVDDCAAACDGLIDAEAVATVNAMSCRDIWSELTFDDPDLNAACQDGIGSDDDWNDDDWDDDDCDETY